MTTHHYNLPPVVEPIEGQDPYEAERERHHSGVIFASMERKLHGRVSKSLRAEYPGLEPDRPPQADNEYSPHDW